MMNELLSPNQHAALKAVAACERVGYLDHRTGAQWMYPPAGVSRQMLGRLRTLGLIEIHKFNGCIRLVAESNAARLAGGDAS